ncbi:hypothetical protein VH569_03235 [Azospirillum sp. 11R-A]|uniref:hypothetical protein n=1 Tax=Azospirillum sp. 11R-A TaxID=3111634 RepID=UPI003C274346
MEFDKEAAGRWLIVEMENHFCRAERACLPFDVAAIATAYICFSAQLGVLAGDVPAAKMADHLREVAELLEGDVPALPVLAWLDSKHRTPPPRATL